MTETHMFIPCGPWRPWFAWWPVEVLGGGWRWLVILERRPWTTATWVSYPCSGWDYRPRRVK